MPPRDEPSFARILVVGQGTRQVNHPMDPQWTQWTRNGQSEALAGAIRFRACRTVIKPGYHGAMSDATPLVIAVLAAELVPAAAFGFAGDHMAQAVGRMPGSWRILLPALLVLPYTVVATSRHMLRWDWFALYAALPVVIAWLLSRAAQADPERRGNWRDARGWRLSRRPWSC